MLRSRTTKGLALVLVLILMTSMTILADSGYKQDILEEISGDNIMGHISELSPGDDARVAGSQGEKDAALYIEGLFNDYGLEDVGMPEFDTVIFHDGGSEFAVNIPTDIVLNHGSLNMEFTKAGTVTADLVYAGLGGVDDFTGIDVTGKIALVKRGEYYFSEKVQNAAAAGAIGAVLFNNIMEEGFINGTLGEKSVIPAIEIHPEDGEALAALLQEGVAINVTVTTVGETEDVTSQNVVGTLYAEGNKKNTPSIVIGAHYDCVDTPGANDNASGTATMLELARVLSQYKYDANITFIAFGAEEVGLVGAYDYVEHLDKSAQKNIAAMLNMDMVGVGDEFAIWTIGDKASDVIAELAETYVLKSGLANKGIGVEDRSDHAAFAENGIPAVYFSYEVDPNYHTDEDVIDHIKIENIENTAKIVAEMTYDMAEAPRLQSTQGFNGTVNKYRHINPNKAQE